MPPSDVHHDRVFLSVISYPEGMSQENVVDLLARSGGLDAPTLSLKMRQTPPCIVAVVDPPAAEGAVRALIEHGGDGFAPTLADLAALGPTLKIKDMRIGVDGLQLELWRGPVITLAPSDVQILVRVHLSETTQDPTRGAAGAVARARYAHGGAIGAVGRGLAFGWGVGGAHGWATRLYTMRDLALERAAEQQITVSHKLDIHAADGRVFQIDGDKFGFHILGDRRAMSDNVNIDRMCEFFAHLNAEAVVDPYFRYWHPPAGHHRLRLPNMKVNNDDPAFAFYSRWAALMYRHVMGV